MLKYKTHPSGCVFFAYLKLNLYICNVNKEDMEKEWIYFGVFLDSISKAKNLNALETNGIVIPNEWKRFNHHMTIAYNNGSKEVYDLYKYYQVYLEDPSMETDITLTINGIGISDDAIALRVDWALPIANKTPHITMATPQTGKPVNSNKITEWVDIKPYTVKGVIRRIVEK